ncbi:MAG: zinc-binding alcohol dehydrogenase [Planctomycetes bacterium]|nr:zinc-binding alcohol dehydrogenase [Planctomycetota bacterium]
MPFELVIAEPYKLDIREYEEPPLSDNHVRVKSEFSSSKHGTERGFYRGTAALTRGHMNQSHIYVQDDTKKSIYPYLLGNLTVGRVIETGRKVTKWKIGERVFFYGGFRQIHTVSENELKSVPEDMSAEGIVYLDPAKYAFGGILDGGVRLGFRVAVFGLGAIGQMAVQMARLSGALEVFGIDPYEFRRKMAERYGATKTLNPLSCDVGKTIKEATSGEGVDVSIEVSGIVSALQQAIRTTMRGGKIVTVGLYEGKATDLHLDEDWHRNQQVMIASQGPNFPSHVHPYWAGPRWENTVFELLRRNWLKSDGLVCPIVPFDKSAQAYKEIDENPSNSIKLGVKY